MTGTKQLLGFIIDQKLDLEQYQEKLPEMIREKFFVEPFNAIRGFPEEALVGLIVDWEKGKQFESLEGTIQHSFKITTKEGAFPAKVLNLPNKDTPALRKATTHVGGVINREMIALQKKFPDYRFELKIELQELGKQIFYKVGIKTFKDE